MRRIAKKPHSVKRQKAGKPAPRYAIRKDSLNRRYAIDKRTGKRVSVSKAEKERSRLKKASPVFRGIRESKPPKVNKTRSEASKKGWETRRKRSKAAAEVAAGTRTTEELRDSELPPPVPIATQLPGPPLIPAGMRMVVLGGIADRMQQYPKVKAAAENAWNRLQASAYTRAAIVEEGKKPEPMQTKKFDVDHGKGTADFIRYELFTRAMDIQDIDQIIEDLTEEEDSDYSARELYTLFFSPDVA